MKGLSDVMYVHLSFHPSIFKQPLPVHCRAHTVHAQNHTLCAIFRSFPSLPHPNQALLKPTLNHMHFVTGKVWFIIWQALCCQTEFKVLFMQSKARENTVITHCIHNFLIEMVQYRKTSWMGTYTMFCCIHEPDIESLQSIPICVCNADKKLLAYNKP